MKKPLRAVMQMSVVVNNTSELKRPSVEPRSLSYQYILLLIKKRKEKKKEPRSLRLSPYLEAALSSLD